MFVRATIRGSSAGLIQQAGPATKEQLPDHAGYCLAMATRNRSSGVDEVVVVVSTDVICTQLILPVNRLSLAV
jgi:hypothetical protein